MAKNDNDQQRVPFERYDRPATFILSNLTWIVLVSFIVTLPLGMVGLFQVMSLWTRGKQPEFFRDFFGAIRTYWWKALLIGLIDFVIGGITFANLTILNTLGFDNLIVLLIGTMNVFIAVVAVLANMYIWSLLVVAEFGLQQILILSVKLVFAHPVETVITSIIAFLPLIVALIVPFPAIVWFVGLISLSALTINKGTWRVIRRYLPEAELLQFENKEP